MTSCHAQVPDGSVTPPSVAGQGFQCRTAGPEGETKAVAATLCQNMQALYTTGSLARRVTELQNRISDFALVVDVETTAYRAGFVTTDTSLHLRQRNEWHPLSMGSMATNLSDSASSEALLKGHARGLLRAIEMRLDAHLTSEGLR